MARLRAWCASPLFKPTRGAPAHVGVRGPVDHEQGAFDTADFPQGPPPARSGAGTRRACAGAGSAAWSRPPWWPPPAGCPPQLRSIKVHVHLAADQRAQALRDARAFEHVEALRGQVPDARDERVAEDRARGEDMVGEAARVGVLFADAPPGLVHQEPIEDVGRFVDGGRDGLGGERGEPVGDVRVQP